MHAPKWYWTVLVCVLSALAGAAIGIGVNHLLRKRKRSVDGRQLIRRLLEKHFRPLALDSLTISERKFSFRVRADLQRAIDQHFTSVATITHFCGVRKEHALGGINFAALLVDGYSPAVSVPPEYEEVDIGEDTPVRSLKNGLWLLEEKGRRYAVLFSPAGRPYDNATGIQFQIATANDAEGTRMAWLSFSIWRKRSSMPSPIAAKFSRWRRPNIPIRAHLRVSPCIDCGRSRATR